MMPLDPAPVEDDDTRTAFLAQLAGDPDAVTALVGGMTSGKVLSKVVQGKTPATPMPYAEIECEQGPKPNEYIAPVQRGQGYHDFRHVTICVYGVRADAVKAMGHLRRIYEWQPRPTTETGTRQMDVPNASLKAIRPMPGSGKIEQEKERVGGNIVWKGTLEFECWTVRVIV
jgi:hypothetical protein